MQVTLQTTIEEILDAYPDATKVFEDHGIVVEIECEAVLDWPLEDCEFMCQIDDIEQLVADLNAFIREKEGAEVTV